jgi:TolB-like protein
VHYNLAFQNKLERTTPPNREESKTQTLNATTTDVAHTTSSAEYIASGIKQHKRSFGAGLLILLVAAIGLGYWFFANRSANATQIESIAVLPFVNESGNADVEYLSDGMTETLINSLSQLPKLSVKARSSVFRYKGKETDARQVGADLNVQAVLNGRVVQRNDELTLYLSLVDAATENQIWGKPYNRKLSDLVSLQNEIAYDVSQKLKTRLSGVDERNLEKTYTENSEAYQLYLKGRYHWYRFPSKDFEKSRDYFQQAIDIDPSFALAYAGLADYYGFASANGILPPNENWLKVQTAAKKAQELDESRGEAYNPLAAVRVYYYRDWAGAEREFKRGIELSPNYAEIRHHYALRLVGFGEFEESLAQMKKALELEPLSVRFNRSLAMVFYKMRDYDRAIEQYRKTLELEPNDAFTHELLGNTYEQKGMQKEAVAAWNKAFMLTGDIDLAMMLERTYAASGFNAAVRALWQKKLERLNEKAKRGEYVPAMDYVLAYTRLADKEQALTWLVKAEQERNAWIFDIKLDPIYDSLRSDPRFQDLLRRVGLTP